MLDLYNYHPHVWEKGDILPIKHQNVKRPNPLGNYRPTRKLKKECHEIIKKTMQKKGLQKIRPRLVIILCRSDAYRERAAEHANLRMNIDTVGWHSGYLIKNRSISQANFRRYRA